MDFERKSIKTEFEIEKWRSINGERHSPILSLKDDEEKMSTLKTANYYITLAKESPQRIFEDSDESTYDSYHCRETDVCRDSTDLDDSDSGSSSSFNAIMEVVEYEIASIVGDEALYSNDSSSGSDDFFLTNITLRDVRQSRNYNSGFADTEGSYSSDNNYDPELSLADYWKCVKCKNRQNNPMFRYCEKCYQIRKSHFPPRPRRANLKRKRNISPVIENGAENSSLQQNDCQNSKTVECNNKSGMDNSKHTRHKKRKFNHSTNNNELSSSYTETNSENCSTESSDTETENIFTRGGRDSRKRKISKMKESINYKNNNNNNNSSSNIRNNSINLSEKERKKLSSVEINDNFVNNVINKTFSSAIKCNDLANSIPMLSQKDSGFSSTPSSQEIPSSSSQSDDIQFLKNDNDNSSDSDSATDNLNNKNLNFKNIPINKSNDKEFNQISKSYKNLSNEKKFIKNSSNFSSLDPISNNSSEKQNEIPSSSSTSKLNIIKKKDDVKTDINTIENDQCVVCLSEPKNGAFIHTKSAHICCCYRCAVKIWNTRKKCPICNCSVKNVLKLFVH